jgi:hypothetical protein
MLRPFLWMLEARKYCPAKAIRDCVKSHARFKHTVIDLDMLHCERNIMSIM